MHENTQLTNSLSTGSVTEAIIDMYEEVKDTRNSTNLWYSLTIPCLTAFQNINRMTLLSLTTYLCYECTTGLNCITM